MRPIEFCPFAFWLNPDLNLHHHLHSLCFISLYDIIKPPESILSHLIETEHTFHVLILYFIFIGYFTRPPKYFLFCYTRLSYSPSDIPYHTLSSVSPQSCIICPSDWTNPFITQKTWRLFPFHPSVSNSPSYVPYLNPPLLSTPI